MVPPATRDRQADSCRRGQRDHRTAGDRLHPTVESEHPNAIAEA
jgi:hypothetical protein